MRSHADQSSIGTITIPIDFVRLLTAFQPGSSHNTALPISSTNLVVFARSQRFENYHCSIVLGVEAKLISPVIVLSNVMTKILAASKLKCCENIELLGWDPL